MKRSGATVIEILIAISLAAVVIVAIGNLTAATHRLTTSTGKELQATALARQWLDVAASQANSTAVNKGFGCSCGATSCTSCTSNGQTCMVRGAAGFKSCWVGRPLGISSGTTEYKLVLSSGAFTWQSANGARDTSVAGFQRWMTIANLQRDGAGAIIPGSSETSCDSTHDCNTKLITVFVSWTDGTATRQKQQSTVLTAWKNF